MSYNADDFYEDVVSKSKSLDEIINTPCDNRGLGAFLRYLVSHLGEGSLSTGCQSLMDYCGSSFIVHSVDGKTELLGDLPQGYRLMIKSVKED